MSELLPAILALGRAVSLPIFIGSLRLTNHSLVCATSNPQADYVVDGHCDLVPGSTLFVLARSIMKLQDDDQDLTTDCTDNTDGKQNGEPLIDTNGR
jgi:hypothetical protein